MTNVNNGLETKDFPIEIKSVSDEGTFEGYASISGNVDSYGDIVMPGAFSKSLAKHKREGTKPPVLWQHNADEPIGYWAELSDDGKGLYGKGVLISGVRRADEARILLKEKVIRGLSIGYRTVRSEPSKEKGALLLHEIDLYEASIVTFPANQRALVTSVKSERMEEFVRRLRKGDAPSIKEFEEFLRDAGFPKALATALASAGYAKAIRGEPDSKNDVASFLKAMISP